MSSLSNNCAFYSRHSDRANGQFHNHSESDTPERQTDRRTDCRPINAALQISFSINKPHDLWHWHCTGHNVIIIIGKIFLLLSYFFSNYHYRCRKTIVNHATLSDQCREEDQIQQTTEMHSDHNKPLK